jgi:DNA primase
MQRFPHGAGGSSFFQKRVPKGAPEWLETTIVSTPNGTTSRALVLADMAHVVWAVNLACLGFHVWPYVAGRPEVADELRLDLDPQPGVDFEQVRAAAAEVRGFLDELGIVGYPKTTGNRGLHVYVRLGRGRRRAGARAAPAGAHHGRLVEGGARPPRLRRLQPERAAQDRLRPVVGARAAGRAGLGAGHVGRDRRAPPG